MTVRIKRLELSGFKSFPRSTVFEFDTGITAIIGPNGSGKSNIADAMRWVLGEQSYSNIRGRKAEDVIFSGSSARAAVGMAEVTLTLDNSSGDLPVEFQEVSITRRAYRSGENQYLINGAKVRLKDISQITASLGQSHTVIGQGLVDAALSQRPEERRGLFEHAAGITGLRLKHAATARHLAETESNSTRLEDLLNELEPRLKTLERQARQAREYADVQAQLRETALRYYSSLWREHQARLRSLRDQVSETETELQQANQDLEASKGSLEGLEAELQSLTQRSRELEEQANATRTGIREMEHQIELTRQRRDGLSAEIERMDDRRDTLLQESGQIEQQITEQGAESECLQRNLDDLQERLSRKQAERTSLEEQISSLIEQRDRIDAQREETRQRLYRNQAEQEYRQQQRDDLLARSEHLTNRREELEAGIAGYRKSIEQAAGRRHELEQQIARHRSELDSLAAELASGREMLKSLRDDLEKRDADRSSKTARLDALQRLQESGEGLHRGVQAVLDGSRTQALSGVIGTLASQIKVPSELETGIEAALGGHLQDIVVRRWADAESAIEYLKQKNAGRATFQPLDTQRSSGNRNRPAVQGKPGVRGIAVDLIEFADELEPVLEGLLGRTVVTDDLPSTRGILGSLRPGWTVVTLEGEVTRAGGSVTGGSRVRQSGTLSRERELRDLPGEIETLEGQRQDLLTRIQQAEEHTSGLESRLEERRQELRGLEGDLDAIQREEASLKDQLSQAEQNLDGLEQEKSEALAEVESRAAEIEQLSAQQREDNETLEGLEAQRSDLAAEIDALQSTGDDEELRRLESERSGLTERKQGLTRQIEGLRSRAGRLQADLARHDSERQATDEAISSLDTELASLRERRGEAEQKLETLTANLEPLGEQRTALEQQLRDRQQGSGHLQQRQRELERSRDSQRFEVERQESQGEYLLERVIDVLEIEDPVPLLEEQPAEDDLDLKKLETDLHRLRQRSRRIGAFGEDTIAQYEQEQERYIFLRGQLDDVQRGAEALQSMLADLERSMATEFDRTFGQVAQAFEVTFQRLFGGGSAQLVRNDDENGTGIDIVAQPPGKRLQSLALLSGGERALTAVALLFAILRVNPSPFCLLDEVDAALDESNVVRFRDELRDLSNNTQFVIVTHNRATIEGADVLYGITMGDDAISRVVSLKLPEEAPVATG